VNAATEKGYTPIFTAAEHHNTAVALLLMDNGADMTLEVWP
jgi:ankyrin repeat protein